MVHHVPCKPIKIINFSIYRGGKDKTVEMLINRGIDVNIKDEFWGQTALHTGLCKIKLKD